MDHDAWMKRGAERQDLLNKLKNSVIREADDQRRPRTFEASLMVAIYAHFITTGTKLRFPFVPSEASVSFLENEILPPIDDFARTEEEAAGLLATFGVWLSSSSLDHYQRPLRMQEMSHPELVFQEPEAAAS